MAWSLSRDLLNFRKIRDNISKTVQDSVIVSIEFEYEVVCDALTTDCRSPYGCVVELTLAWVGPASGGSDCGKLAHVYQLLHYDWSTLADPAALTDGTFTCLW